MAHEPFNLYQRPTTKNNRFVYYVQFYDEDGNRSHHRLYHRQNQRNKLGHFSREIRYQLKT